MSENEPFLLILCIHRPLFFPSIFEGEGLIGEGSLLQVYTKKSVYTCTFDSLIYCSILIAIL